MTAEISNRTSAGRGRISCREGDLSSALTYQPDCTASLGRDDEIKVTEISFKESRPVQVSIQLYIQYVICYTSISHFS